MTSSRPAPGLPSDASFFETPGNAAPAGGEAFWLTTGDGTRLRVARWRKAGSRGTVFVLPGRTETVEKYFETIGELVSRGFSVLTFDWRGQGASSRSLKNPRKGHVSNFAAYLNDLAAILDEVDGECPRPWLLLGHSMGGNIALHALHEWPNDFDAAVLSAPMLALQMPAPGVVRVIARLAPSDLFIVNGRARDPVQEAFEDNPVTHDVSRYARNQGIFKACPAIAIGAPTWGWLNAALVACEDWTRPGFLEKIQTPTLILSASEESIVGNAAHVTAAARLQNSERISVEGARHELLMEGDAIRTRFWAAVDSFLERHLTGT